jgi:hypothetical protein
MIRNSYNQTIYDEEDVQGLCILELKFKLDKIK